MQDGEELKIEWKREHLLEAYYPFSKDSYFKINPHSSRKGRLLISLALIHGWVSLRGVTLVDSGWHGVGEEQVIKFC